MSIAASTPFAIETSESEVDASLVASYFLAFQMLAITCTALISCNSKKLFSWRSGMRCSTPRARPSPRVSRDFEGERTPLRDEPTLIFNCPPGGAAAAPTEIVPPTPTLSLPPSSSPTARAAQPPQPQPQPLPKPLPKMPPKPPPLWSPKASPNLRPKARTKDLFLGLNGARLLASVHIVLGHLYQLNAISSVYLFSWGYTWVPWFFMLSGFVLTHTSLKAAKPRRERPVDFLRKRTATLYPLYAVGLGLALLVNAWRGRALPEWYELLAQGFLVQAWLPWLPEKTVQVHCWFVSALVPYWLLFDWILHHGILKLRSLRATSLTLLLLSLPPWLALIFPSVLPDGNANWYASHRTGKLNDATDYAVVLLKFHPASYFHVFVFGMVLARLRSLLGEQLLRGLKSPPQAARYLERLLRFGATIGYAGLLVVFLVEEVRPPSYKLSARLSVLMLLQGLVLIGLAPIALPAPNDGQSRLRDPLEWLLSKSPAALGNVAYSQYVIHFIAIALWPVERLENAGEVALFFLFLLSASYLCSRLIIPPCNTIWRKASPRALLAIAAAVAAIGAAGCAVHDALRSSPHSVGLASQPMECERATDAPALPPPYVMVAESADGTPSAVDVRLNWTVELSDFAEERDVINPNLLWSGGRLRRAARAHSVVRCVNRSGTYNGSVATEITTTWYSDLAIDLDSTDEADEEAWAQWNVSAWRLDGSAPLRRLDLRSGDDEPWGPLSAAAPRWYAKNRTLLRTVVSGAEDPKLVALPPSFGEGIGVAFSSLPPLWNQEGLGTSGVPRYQMYQTVGAVVSIPPDSPHPHRYRAVASRLQCGLAGTHEKNWISFARGNRLHYVWKVFPHWVITADMEGGCLPARYVSSESTVTEELHMLASTEGLQLHGSGSAIAWSEEHNLALFHTKDALGRYVSFAYLMLSRPPFTVTNVSRPLPLQGGVHSFASSVSIVPGGAKVVVAYGVADAQSRALVMSTDFLRSLFVWEEVCSFPPPPPSRRLLPSSSDGLSQECRDAGLHGRACSRVDRGFIAATCLFFLTLVGCCIRCIRCWPCRCHLKTCSAVITARTDWHTRAQPSPGRATLRKRSASPKNAMPISEISSTSRDQFEAIEPDSVKVICVEEVELDESQFARYREVDRNSGSHDVDLD